MNNNEQNSTEKIDWDDDSGKIHTVKTTYSIKKEDGWQDNRALLTKSQRIHSKTRKIKGRQFGFHYVTDDYRKVIPAYVIGTIFIIAVCIIWTIISPFTGILADIFGAVWIIGIWKKAPFTKWKNQSQNLKEEKEKNQLK